MSWAKAQARIVSIIEAVDIREGAGVIPSLSNRRGRSASVFRHRKDSGDDSPPQDRGFWIDVESVHFRGPMHHGAITSQLANRLRAEVQVSIFYSKDVERSSLIEDAISDYSKIAVALLDPGARGEFEDNRIIGIVLGGNELAPAKFEDVGAGKIMRLKFACEYSNKYGDES